jgi:hypothetical protein
VRSALVFRGKGLRGRGAQIQHANQLAIRPERNAQVRADAFGQQQVVQEVALRQREKIFDPPGVIGPIRKGTPIGQIISQTRALCYFATGRTGRNGHIDDNVRRPCASSSLP